MVKRAKVTTETFDKKLSALDRLIGNQPQQPATPEPEQPATQEEAKGERTYKPTSFYLNDPLLDKLDDLAHDYKKHTGRRINRNDIVRALIIDTDLANVIRVLPPQ
jgi:hypothetical protein